MPRPNLGFVWSTSIHFVEMAEKNIKGYCRLTKINNVTRENIEDNI